MGQKSSFREDKHQRNARRAVALAVRDEQVRLLVILAVSKVRRLFMRVEYGDGGVMSNDVANCINEARTGRRVCHH